MNQLTEDFEATPPTTLRLFMWPIIFAALTALSFAGMVLGGIGPCGGFGIFFIIPFLIFGIATLAALITSSYRAIHNRRTAHQS